MNHLAASNDSLSVLKSVDKLLFKRSFFLTTVFPLISARGLYHLLITAPFNIFQKKVNKIMSDKVKKSTRNIELKQKIRICLKRKEKKKEIQDLQSPGVLFVQ